jgi:predicted Zn-dependent protease with MMP-like domain
MAPLRRIGFAALVALCAGLSAVVAMQGFSTDDGVKLLETIAVIGLVAAVVFGGAIAIGLRLADWREPTSEEEFERVVERSERLAREGLSGDEEWDDEDDDDYGWDGLDPRDRDDFDRLVALALDDLPLEFQRALEQVPVVVSDKGRRRRAYGLYEGDGAARDNFPDRIVIFRDTLVRDFGHDAERLRAEVTRTVRHELAHHLGWNEPGVRGLGL